MRNELPDSFRPLFWDADFSKIDSGKDEKVVIERIINYGSLSQWRFLVDFYGKEKVKKIVEEMPASAFRPQTLRLAELLLGVHITHALRSTH